MYKVLQLAHGTNIYKVLLLAHGTNVYKVLLLAHGTNVYKVLLLAHSTLMGHATPIGPTSSALEPGTRNQVKSGTEMGV